MATIKITNKEYFSVLYNIVKIAGIPEGVETSITPDDLIDWIDTKIIQLNKKATTISKAQKAKIEADAAITDIIIEVLKENTDGLTVTNILAARDELKGFSNQKITALLRKLVEDKVIRREKDKNKALYKIGTSVDNIEVDE